MTDCGCTLTWMGSGGVELQATSPSNNKDPANSLNRPGTRPARLLPWRTTQYPQENSTYTFSLSYLTILDRDRIDNEPWARGVRQLVIVPPMP